MANRARAFSFCGKIQSGKANIVAKNARTRIRFRRRCSDIPRNLFASGGISVVFGNAGGCVIFDSRGRDDDKTSPSGLDPLCLDASVIRFLFLLLRGYPVIIGKLTDRLNFSSLLLHQ